MTSKRVLSAFAFVVGFVLIAPTAIVLPMSVTTTSSFNFPPKGFTLKWYENLFTDRVWLDALLTSCQVAGLVVVTSTVIGTAAAIGIYRLGGRAGNAFRALFLMPMIVPGVVLAIGLYSVFLRMGMLGSLMGFVMAHSVLAIPLVLINVLASLEGYDSRLELAAASLGARKSVVLRTITIPLVLPGIVAGALFAFITSFDEIVLSLFIQSPYLQTLPVKIYRSMTKDTDPTVAAVAVLTLTVSLVLILVAHMANERQRKVRTRG
jgi:putative spermidine/putrescine transport system permease protein